MNSNSKSINKSHVNTARKACCKVCQDAGKPENVYLSHYVKDLNGNVTCPTLLSQECRYCHKKGHTISHCSTLKKQKEYEDNSRKPPLSPVKKEASSPKKANVFAYLDMNSDDESDKEQEQFPQLVASQPKDPFEKEKHIPKKFSYASMAAKTETEYKIEQIKQTNVRPTLFVEKKIKVKMQNFWPTLAPGQKKSWAQIEDEDSSDDEEEEEQIEVEDNSAW